jgi:hypothetical protein
VQSSTKALRAELREHPKSKSLPLRIAHLEYRNETVYGDAEGKQAQQGHAAILSILFFRID